MCLDGKRNDQMAFHALADYQNHVIGWLQWEQSALGDGAVVRFPRIWMSSGECRTTPPGPPEWAPQITFFDPGSTLGRIQTLLKNALPW